MSCEKQIWQMPQRFLGWSSYDVLLVSSQGPRKAKRMDNVMSKKQSKKVKLVFFCLFCFFFNVDK